MFQRILVPVDGSNTSDQALEIATKLAKEQRAQLRIVYVVDETNLDVQPEYAVTESAEAMRKTGQDILTIAETKVHAAGLKAETQLLDIKTLEHHISDVIVDEAKNWQADLIVIGTHGRRGISHELLFGSVAEKLVRIATTPVLLIRGKSQ